MSKCEWDLIRLDCFAPRPFEFPEINFKRFSTKGLLNFTFHSRELDLMFAGFCGSINYSCVFFLLSLFNEFRVVLIGSKRERGLIYFDRVSANESVNFGFGWCEWGLTFQRVPRNCEFFVPLSFRES